MECGGSAAAFDQDSRATKQPRSLSTKKNPVIAKRSEGPAYELDPAPAPRIPTANSVLAVILRSAATKDLLLRPTYTPKIVTNSLTDADDLSNAAFSSGSN